MQKAADTIRRKQSQILYKKIGKRYVAATDVDACAGLREGWWLVRVAPGSTSVRSCLWPDKAEIEAAALDARDKITDIVYEATQAQPPTKEISPEFKRAWTRMAKKFGSEMNMLSYPSAYAAGQKILDAILGKKCGR